MSETRRKLTVADLKPRATAPAKPAKVEPPPQPPVKVEAPRQSRVKTEAQKARRRRKNLKRNANPLIRDEIERLATELPARFPALFTTPPRPLAKGIHRDLIAATGCAYAAVSAALYRWTNRLSYHEAVVAGGPRFALDGTEQGEVTEEDRVFAAQIVSMPAKKKKRGARWQDNPRLVE